MKYLKYFEGAGPWKHRLNQTVAKFKANMNVMDFDEVADYVEKNCKQWIENPKIVLRFISSADEVCFSSKPVERFSRDDYNYYTLIIDNHPSWKEYPKRKNSFICTLRDQYPFGRENPGDFLVIMDLKNL